VASCRQVERLPAPPGSLRDRLYARIERRGPDECHPWCGGVSRGGWREVDYGCIKEAVRTPGTQGRRWRVHRLVLILKTAPIDVPRDEDESEIDWLHRAARWYRGREASHTCDWSLCANEEHLMWQTHEDNVREQAERRQ
jgi:hypothetical protein